MRISRDDEERERERERGREREREREIVQIGVVRSSGNYAPLSLPSTYMCPNYAAAAAQQQGV